jgi:hypothetical protein
MTEYLRRFTGRDKSDTIPVHAHPGSHALKRKVPVASQGAANRAAERAEGPPSGVYVGSM